MSANEPLAFYDTICKLEEFDNDMMTQITNAMKPAPFTPESLIDCVTKLVNRAHGEMDVWWKLKAWWSEVKSPIGYSL